MSCGPKIGTGSCCDKCAAAAAARSYSLMGVGAEDGAPPFPTSHLILWSVAIGVATGIFVHAITWRPHR